MSAYKDDVYGKGRRSCPIYLYQFPYLTVIAFKEFSYCYFIDVSKIASEKFPAWEKTCIERISTHYLFELIDCYTNI